MTANVVNLQRVRDRIAAEPAELLDMRQLAIPNVCGTAHCIEGWTNVVLWETLGVVAMEAEEFLELEFAQYQSLFYPLGWGISGRYTQADALAALDSLISDPDGLPVWPS